MELKTGVNQNEANWYAFFRYCFFAALVIHLLTAWFSIGFQYQDEQSQIMDFAGYKMGMVPLDRLSWEYKEQIRQGIQPFIVVCLYRSLQYFHIANPFLCTLILRVFSTIVGWLSVLFLTKELCYKIESEYWRRFLVLLSCFMWPIAFVQSHFSCESISGSTFFLGVAAILYFIRSRESGPPRQHLLVVAGLLIGFAFIIRIQTVFMVLGLGMWCIIIGRFRFKNMIIMALPGFMVIGLGAVLDHWLYQEWVFTIYKYFDVNLIQGKANSFGTSPFYFYFYLYYIALIPVISVFMLGCIVYSWFRHPRHLFTWICVPFFIGHSLIAHKEVRFLWPMMDAIPYMLILPFINIDYEKIKNQFTRWSLGILWGLNIILLIFFTIKPGYNAFGLYEYLYKYMDHNGKTLIISNVKNPYDMDGATISFQRHDSAKYDMAPDIKAIRLKANVSEPKNILIAINNNAQADSFEKLYPNAPLLYKSWPAWVNYFKVHNTEAVNQVWYLYKWK